MKRYLSIVSWFVTAILIVGLGCQPKPEAQKGAITETVVKAEPNAPAAEAKPAEAKPAEAAPKAEAEKKPAEKAATAIAVPAPKKAEPNMPAEKEPDANSVAVSIDGYNITEGDVTARIKPQVEKMNKQLPAAMVKEYGKQLRQRALDTMVIERLLDGQVKTANLSVSDEDVNDYLGKLATKQGMSMSDLKSLVEASGQDFNAMKQQTKKGLGYQKLMEGQWVGKINITDADGKKYYDENPDRFKTGEQIRASHILIKPDPNGDPNTAKAAAKSKAEELLKKVKEGADFAELAKANSNCPSAARGGDLGLFGRGRMVKPFEDAAFAMKPGQTSDVVETQFGYHIIKVTEHQDANTVPYEQAKGDIVKNLTQQKQGEFAKEYIDSLKTKAKIVYPNAPKAESGEPNAVERPKE